MLAGMFAPSARWHPRALFGAGEPGVVFDWSRAASLYQDSARTTLVNAAGDPIGSVTDESGNGKHASQATSTSRGAWNGSAAVLDGVDDSWLTPSIDFTGTSKVTLVASVKKTTGNNNAAIAELSSAWPLNQGSFSFWANAGSVENYDFSARPVSNTTHRAARAGSTTDIVVAQWDFSASSGVLADQLQVWINGISVSIAGAGSNAWPFGNFPLFLGRRNNASNPFNGWYYRMIVIGRLLTATELARAEAWAAKPAGVVLP